METNKEYTIAEAEYGAVQFLKQLLNISEDVGREGCTYNDTRYDSEAAAYGYNNCLYYIKRDVEKFLATPTVRKSPTVDKAINESVEEKPTRFSISLVYVNQQSSMLRVLQTDAVSEEEALGIAIKYFKEETTGYNLSMKVVLPIEQSQSLQEQIRELREVAEECLSYFNCGPKAEAEEMMAFKLQRILSKDN